MAAGGNDSVGYIRISYEGKQPLVRSRGQRAFFGQKRTFASPLTGNADLKEFLHSHSVDFPSGKKLAHNDLHSRKI